MRTGPSRFFLGALVLTSVGLMFGCTARPCPCAVAAPVSSACTAAPVAAASAAVPVVKPELAWDGESADRPGKGWSDCQDKNDCKVTLEPKAKAGHGGSAGLEFSAKGRHWLGFGWNWFGWWPADSGTDASKHQKLHLWIKITAEPGKKKPPPEALTVALVGSSKGGKDTTEAVKINDHAPGFADGEWHEIAVPLQALRYGKGATFDFGKVWEIDIGAWTDDDCEYKIALDDIGFI